MTPNGNRLEVEIAHPAALGRLIVRRRKDLGLTQRDVSDFTNVGRRFVSELENGKPTVELGRVLKVLEGLGIKLVASAPRPLDLDGQ